MPIAMFSGATCVLLLMSLYLLSIPNSALEFNGVTNIDSQLLSSLTVFRFIFMINLFVLFSAIIVQLLRRFQINYLFIFEISPSHKVT